jgi:diguanylate cyclase (GGDEF)-like protein
MNLHPINQELIFNQLNIGLIIINTEGRILLWNDWMEKHSGTSKKVALGKPLSSVFQSDPSTSFINAVNNCIKYGLPSVLSSALHRSPLALFANEHDEKNRLNIQQSISLSCIENEAKERLCLIQVFDASAAFKREKILRTQSETLKKDATTDSLTGLYNRRFFDEHYKMALGQAIRQKLPLSVFIIDIDYFKDYNDNYGHPTGDKALIQVAQILRQQLSRSSDMLARYGGEEFVLVLPNMPDEHSIKFANRLINAVMEAQIIHDYSQCAPHLTISIGVSTYDPNLHREASILVDAADSALYKAKSEGRNRVCAIPLETLLAHRQQLTFPNK